MYIILVLNGRRNTKEEQDEYMKNLIKRIGLRWIQEKGNTAYQSYDRVQHAQICAIN